MSVLLPPCSHHLPALCFQMPGPLWPPIQHSQHSSSLGPALQYPWLRKQEPTFNCSSAAGSGIDEQSPCIIKEITAQASDVFICSQKRLPSLGHNRLSCQGRKALRWPIPCTALWTALGDADGIQLLQVTNTHILSCPLPVDFSVEQVTPIYSVC